MRNAPHPEWCGGGHVCSADRAGEHRSHPLTMDIDVARIIATRLQTTSGRNRLEVRTVLELPRGDLAAGQAAGVMLAGIRRALGGAR